MKASRSLAMLLVGVATTGALALGVAAPANAVVVNYYDYAQTLPASVIDTIPDEQERVAWTNGTRSAVTTTPKAPLPSGTFSRPGGGVAIFGAVGTVASMIDGATHVAIQYDRSGERPSYIPADEWDACALSGGDDWLGNIFDGARDWFATFGGTDCNEVRAGWEVPIDPGYEPIHMSTGIAQYPFAVSAAGVTVNLGVPFWSSHVLSYGGYARQEGWVVPIQLSGMTSTTGLFAIQVTTQTYSSAGVLSSALNSSVQVSGYTDANRAGQWLFQPAGDPNTISMGSQSPRCGTEFPEGATAGCLVMAGAMPGSWYPGQLTAGSLPVLTKIAVRGTNFSWTTDLPIQPTPYVSPASDSPGPSAPGAEDVVLMTTVKTAAGHSFTCTTAPFKETEPSAPAPCSPVVPEWEIETERTTEIVPVKELPTYVPTTSPSKEIQKITTPQPLRDWEEDFPDCQERVCKLFLMTILDDGTELNCMDDPSKCADWSTRADKATKFKCYYDGIAVALAECGKYARLFQPGALEAGTAYPAPGGATPGQQTSTSPGPATSPGDEPADATKPRECWPTGWGLLNPFEWVYKPVRCVVEWAFVPRESKIREGVSRIRDGWGLTSIQQVTVLLEALIDAMPDDGGCGGIPFAYDMRGVHVEYQLLNSCDGPLAPAAAVTKSILTGAIIFAAVMAATRYIGSIFGFVGYGQVMEMRAAERAERKGGSS